MSLQCSRLEEQGDKRLNIKMDIREGDCQDVLRMELAQDHSQCWI
jgi:hypothetical protein